MRSSLAGGSALVVVDVTPLVDSETEVPVAEDAVVDDESEDAEDADVADDMTAWSSRSAPFSWTGHRMGWCARRGDGVRPWRAWGKAWGG